MDNNIVFMYSGQGSQYKNMGLELYHREPVFKYWMDRLDKYFISYTQSSFFDQFYVGKGMRESKELIHTHLAIFMVEYALTQVLFNQGIYPDVVIGVSLGEFSASAVNERINPAECMDMIYHQARIVSSCCPKGRMISVLSDLQIYEEYRQLHENAELVSYNFNNNFTIAVIDERIATITDFLNKNKIGYIILSVEYGFHSSLITKGQKPYLEYLAGRKLSQEGELPFVQYSSALVSKVFNISRDFYWEAVGKPIDFQNTAIKAVDETCTNLMVDLGPSGTLATSCRYIFKNENIKPYTILTPYGGSEKNLNLLYQDVDL